MIRFRKHFKKWDAPEAGAMLRAIESELAALGYGYHVAMIGTARVRLPELELVVFPDVKEEHFEEIKKALWETTLELRGTATLDEPKKFGQHDCRTALTYEHGKGKNMRRVRVFFQEVEPTIDGEMTSEIAQHAAVGPCLCGETHTPA